MQSKPQGASLSANIWKSLKNYFWVAPEFRKKAFFLFVGKSLVNIRNCLKLRRLSLVGTELSTDIVSEILLALQTLEWLDISYSTLNKDDLSKVEKLKIFNKNIEIVSQIWSISIHNQSLS